MISRLNRSPLLVFAMASVVGCFDDPSVNNNSSTMAESDTDGLPEEEDESSESGQPETTAEAEAETDTEEDTDTEAETDGCDAAGCPCDGPIDCGDGLECIQNQCTVPVCGDGMTGGAEQCDDGNAVDGDGCDTDCTYTQILAIDAGAYHNCVLIEGGRVRCWGLGLAGQLGLGKNENVGDDELPNEVADVDLPAPAVQISTSSDQHTCALLEDETVRCWGINDSGQLGYANTTALNAPGPAVQVGLADIAQLDTGGFHTCVRTPSATVRCWGRGSLGRLGYGNTANVGDDEHPSSVGNVMIGGPVSKLASGGAHNCIISGVGTVRCWGRGDLGQLGYGNPQHIGDNEVPSTAGDISVIPVGLGPFTKVTQISVGTAHTCAVFDTGEGLCWGDGTFGQTGTGNTAALGDDELPSSAIPLAFPDAIASITAGAAHSCALLEHGDIYCWGNNGLGQLGYGNTDNIGDDEPADSGGLVTLGGPTLQLAAGFFHTCALTKSNEVRCWGINDGGQLGLGHTDKVGDDELPIEEPPAAIF